MTIRPEAYRQMVPMTVYCQTDCRLESPIAFQAARVAAFRISTRAGTTTRQASFRFRVVRLCGFRMAASRPRGLEPLTWSLASTCSIQLSYDPVAANEQAREQPVGAGCSRVFYAHHKPSPVRSKCFEFKSAAIVPRGISDNPCITS